MDDIRKEKLNFPKNDSKDHSDYLKRLMVYKDIQSRKKKHLKPIKLTDSDEDPINNAKLEDLNGYMNTSILTSEKFVEEFEITDGKLCPFCKHKSGRIQAQQFRAPDEPTGIIQICTRKNCGKPYIISKG